MFLGVPECREKLLGLSSAQFKDSMYVPAVSHFNRKAAASGIVGDFGTAVGRSERGRLKSTASTEISKKSCSNLLRLKCRLKV